jgi:hypothetical protein
MARTLPGTATTSQPVMVRATWLGTVVVIRPGTARVSRPDLDRTIPRDLAPARPAGMARATRPDRVPMTRDGPPVTRVGTVAANKHGRRSATRPGVPPASRRGPTWVKRLGRAPRASRRGPTWVIRPGRARATSPGQASAISHARTLETHRASDRIRSLVTVVGPRRRPPSASSALLS